MERKPKLGSAQGPAEMFTGTVWVDVIAKGDLPSRLRVNLVRFTPGARTAWHRHAGARRTPRPLSLSKGPERVGALGSGHANLFEALRQAQGA